MGDLKIGSVLLHGDTRCLNRCTFCDGNLLESPETSFSKFLKNSNYFIKNNYSKVEISGADPIQNSRIVEAVKYLKEGGIPYVTISTHGRNLHNKKLAEELAEAGLDSVRVPLYGIDAASHNKIAQYTPNGSVPVTFGNAFEETSQGISNCSAVGIKVNGHIVPNQNNKNYIPEIIDLYLKLTSGHMESLIVASACITNTSLDYTSDWYLPIKDCGPFLKKVINHKISQNFPNIYFKILDFPFCAAETLTNIILNNKVVPDLGEDSVPDKLRSKDDESTPHYRVKKYMPDCDQCLAKSVCAGIYANDLKMFGSKNLNPITTETILKQNLI